MALRLYNTLTRQAEAFEPLQPGRVSLYTCGPTVYNYAHIGNFRTFLFEDLLRRWLEASGYEVFHIMNLTDVDDRTIAAAREKGLSLRDHVQHFIEAFHEDRHYLRIKDASVYPRATEYIGAMVALVEGLLKKGVAYKGEDGSVYFSIARFPEYGRLSRLDTRELKTGASARVSSDEYAKEDARDFALWKAAKPEDEAVGAAWEAPFGRGRPGWHLECSAMALALIGGQWGTDILDIHAGGVDLIFPHHEDEIAQSCAYTGRNQFARFWLHGEFLNIRGAKMSKRFGNITTPRDLREDGVDPGAIRLLMFQTHYRQKLDLTDEALTAAQEASRRLGEFQNRLLENRSDSDSPRFAAAAQRLDQDVREALDDDLNAPRAVAAVFTYMNEGHAALDAGDRPGASSIAAWQRVEDILGVASKVVIMKIEGGAVEAGRDGAELSELPPADAGAVEPWALAWARRRKEQKTAKNYAEADRIRELLKAAGWEVRDKQDGSVEVVRIKRAS
ncbi:MAG TPA: cysteine--tRNA ligase [Gemmatimonadales bacterium]|nr:cysteine--tRNA ligase [Gemmatimonadales bacterium]